MTCSTDLAALYEAIMARTTGKAVQQAGAKSRQVSYANVPLGEMIKLYRQLWRQCGKDSGLPLLDELDASTAQRGQIRVRNILR
ncbi:MAG: hypothetical protein AB7K67_00940 [Hyphomicrobiaceae bacterium]